MQHQELLVYDIKHLLCDLYRPPARKAWPPYDGVKGMAAVEGGLYLLGSEADVATLAAMAFRKGTSSMD